MDIIPKTCAKLQNSKLIHNAEQEKHDLMEHIEHLAGKKNAHKRRRLNQQIFELDTLIDLHQCPITRLKSLEQLDSEILRLQALHETYKGREHAKRRRGFNVRLKQLISLRENYDAALEDKVQPLGDNDWEELQKTYEFIRAASLKMKGKPISIMKETSEDQGKPLVDIGHCDHTNPEDWDNVTLPVEEEVRTSVASRKSISFCMNGPEAYTYISEEHREVEKLELNEVKKEEEKIETNKSLENDVLVPPEEEEEEEKEENDVLVPLIEVVENDVQGVKEKKIINSFDVISVQDEGFSVEQIHEAPLLSSMINVESVPLIEDEEMSMEDVEDPLWCCFRWFSC